MDETERLGRSEQEIKSVGHVSHAQGPQTLVSMGRDQPHEVNESSAQAGIVGRHWALAGICFGPFFFTKNVTFSFGCCSVEVQAALTRCLCGELQAECLCPGWVQKETEISGKENEHLFSSSNQWILLLLSRKREPEKISAYLLVLASSKHLSTSMTY